MFQSKDRMVSTLLLGGAFPFACFPPEFSVVLAAAADGAFLSSTYRFRVVSEDSFALPN